ncbi:hypothetical protein HanXRQr2_Chr01g0024221 [Helianthus annuus]|uniref:Uncharacterized protein n=1 Tax=Helianthus annuus TaxID=4232 RepID=A0A9K3P3M0_HELAN|nr:hypothetical protein HanXRQr2_Chr01g0024221 [Helianthus annuus]
MKMVIKKRNPRKDYNASSGEKMFCVQDEDGYQEAKPAEALQRIIRFSW